MLSVPPDRGQAPAGDSPHGSEPPLTPDEENASYRWFVVAIAVVVVPFALILIWVVSDAPKYLFQK